MHGDDVVGTRHRYGKGEAVWLPSLVELGGWHGDNKGVADFYGTYCRGQIDRAPLHFSRPADGVLTLLLLVSAFVKGNWRRIYDYALGHDFRFLSYGDSSLLIP